MTRGLTEIARLGVKLGAKQETFAGLSGVGDLIVTCCSMHSRNRRAGILIGKGRNGAGGDEGGWRNGRGLLRDRGGLSPCTAAGRVHADHRSDVRCAVRRNACSGRRSSICSIVRVAASTKRSGCTEKLKRKRKENRRCVPSVFCISEKICEKKKEKC